MLTGKMPKSRNGWGRTALILVGVIALACLCGQARAAFFDDQFLLGAHRGGMDLWPENTTLAFAEAAGYWPDVILECDAQLTSDGAVVLIHDDTVDRTTNGTGAVSSMTRSQIQSFDAAYHFTLDGATYPYRGQGVVVPTLQAALSAVPNGRFQIELKGTDTALADQALGIIQATGAQSRVLLCSFDPAMMDRVRQLSSTVVTCYDPENAAEMMAAYTAGGATWDAYAPEADVLSIDFTEFDDYGLSVDAIAAIQAKGVLFQVFTLNTETDILQWLSIGADGILSDDPYLLNEVIEDWNDDDDPDEIPEGGYGTISTVGTGTDAITLVRVGGSRREMGRWYGKLLGDQISAAASSLLEYAGATEDVLNMAVAAMWRAQYFDTGAYQEEFEGIAEGCAEIGHSEVTVQLLQYMHVIPDLSELGCSLFAAWGDATTDGKLYQLRNLDWIMDAGVQDYPVVAIFEPRDGNVHTVIGFAGMIGAIGGMNEHGIAQSQIMGHFCDNNESLNGVPMPILLREVLYHDTTLTEALARMQNATRTNEYYYCISDANAADPQARLLLTSASRFDVYADNESVDPHPCPDEDPFHDSLDDVVYWRRHDGGGNDIIYNYANDNYGTINASRTIEIAQAAGVDGTLMSIVYNASDLEFYVAYANGSSQPAHTQGYVHFDLEPGGIGGEGYMETVGEGEDEIPVVVVSGTPYEMGYHYGRLVKDEAAELMMAFRAMSLNDDPDRYSDQALDLVWIAMYDYIDERFIEEMQGFADGSDLPFELIRRAHTIPVVSSYSCSAVAAWGNATASGELYQTRDLDWEVAVGEYPCIVVYKPDEGLAHMNVTFTGFIGSHTGINEEGIVLSEMGDSPDSEYPYDVAGTHFPIMFRTMLYDADNLTETIDILEDTTRIKRYHYVFGDGKNEFRAVKVKAHAPETPPADLIIWEDNDPTDEFAPNVFNDIVYNDEGRGAYSLLAAVNGSIDENSMIDIANAIAMTNSNTMNVVYNATTLEAWVAYAGAGDYAYQRPYVHVDMNDYLSPPVQDSDGDGIPDDVEGDGDPDLDGLPNYVDLDSDGDGISDALEGAEDADGDGDPNFLDTDSDDDGLPDSEESTLNHDSDDLEDFLDPDSDNDGILDGVEGTDDVDGDGLANYIDTDSDDDGLPDIVETTTDIDGDGVPNYLDSDSDDDGIPDSLENEAGTDPYDASDPGGGITFKTSGPVDLLPQAFYEGDSSDGSFISGRHAMFGATSSDGKKVAFWGVNASTRNAGIFVVEIGDSSSWRRLTSDYTNLPDMPLSWTPDNLNIIQGTISVALLNGQMTSFTPFGYLLTEQSCTAAQSDNWLIGTYNPDPMVQQDQKEELVAVPILTNGKPDLTREPVQVTNFSATGAVALEWPSLAPDLSAVAFVQQPYPSPDSSREHGNVYALTDLQAILAAPKLSGTDISSLAPTELSDSRIVPVRVADAYADAPYFSPSADFVFYTEEWNQQFLGGVWTFVRMADADFEVMISRPDGYTPPFRLNVAGNQAYASPTPGGTRLVYVSGLEETGPVPLRTHLLMTSLQVRNLVEGTTVGNPANSDVLLGQDATYADDGHTTVAAQNGTMVDLPAGADLVVGIRTPLFPPTSLEIPASADTIPVSREILPLDGTYSSPVRVTIPYTQAQVAGVYEPGLRVAAYNDTTGQYDIQMTNGVVIDADNNTVSFLTTHNGLFGLLADWDTDTDGTPDRTDDDDDNDGIPDAEDVYPLDTDNDGIPNNEDGDDDMDGISDAEDPMPFDTDNDGLDNGVDPDDDSDGIPDVDDAYPYDTNNSGTPNDADNDDDDDGIPDEQEGNDDLDGDGIGNCFDTDSDGDGIPDATESVSDTDLDGIPDYKDTDADGDGIPDLAEGTNDMDKDLVPNYRDLDSDGDLIRDKDEGTDDMDEDDAPNYLDLDSDDDGLSDQLEGKVNRALVYLPPMDSDLDGSPDYLDLDSDGDGIGDNEYLQQWDATEGSQDADDDGVPNYLDLDSDNDDLSDDEEMNIGTNPYSPDTDEDGVVDRAEYDNETDPLSSDSYTELNVDPALSVFGSGAGSAGFDVANMGEGTMAWTAAKRKGTTWFDITSGAAGVNSGQIHIVYDANATPVQRTGEISVSAPNSLNSPFTVKLVQDGCDPPTPPGGVAASDGTYSDRVRVTWNAVAGVTEYQVYRGITTSTAAARPVSGWVEATQFDDKSALPPKTTNTGCFGTSAAEYTKYYYWVKSRNECVESAFGTANQGWAGTGALVKDAEIYQKALPGAMVSEAVHDARQDSSLYVRLRSVDEIDPESIWGLVSSSAFETADVEWFPVVEGSLDDIWVVYTPSDPWPAGEEIIMTAGAETLAGERLESTYVFLVETAVQALARSAKTSGEVLQPAYEQLDTSDMDLTAESAEATVTLVDTDALAIPALLNGAGPVFEVSPAEAYGLPQRVWFPMPDGTDASYVTLRYFLGDGADAGWYPAENVAGWLVPGSELTVEVNGTAYYGVLVRHGGIVQLEVTPAAEPVAPASSGDSAGDLVAWGVAACLLLLVGKWRPRRRTSR